MLCVHWAADTRHAGVCHRVTPHDGSPDPEGISTKIYLSIQFKSSNILQAVVFNLWLS